MAHEQTPIEYYLNIESRLSPILRDRLNELLPKIAGKQWWKSCVLTSLSQIQLDNVTLNKNLDQFDLPALVAIFIKNWHSLRPLIGCGNELLNYLITIRTFRNDAMHHINLNLDVDRVQHLEKTTLLAIKLLTSSPEPIKNTDHKPRKITKRYSKFLLFVILICCCLGISARYHNEIINFLNKEKIYCERLHYALEVSEQFRDIVDVDSIFVAEQEEYKNKCANHIPKQVQLTLDEMGNLHTSVSLRVSQKINTFTQNSFITDSEFVLWEIYSVLVNQGVFKEGEYDKNKEALKNILHQISLNHNFSARNNSLEEILNLIKNKNWQTSIK